MARIDRRGCWSRKGRRGRGGIRDVIWDMWMDATITLRDHRHIEFNIGINEHMWSSNDGLFHHASVSHSNIALTIRLVSYCYLIYVAQASSHCHPFIY